MAMQDVRDPIRYEARLERVLDHIHAHLDGELDMEALADVACLSPYHWHRVYRAITGETLAITVRRLRLHRAAGDLLLTRMPIADVAARWGYGDVASFTRTFAAAYGMPPGRYRSEGQLQAFELRNQTGVFPMQDIDIVTIEPIVTAGLPHAGAYLLIGRSFDKVYGLAQMRGLMGATTRGLGIYYDDPQLLPEAELRSFAAISLAEGAEPAAPLEKRTIEGGTYATILHKGPYAELQSSYDALYGGWLPRSGRQLRDAPPFEEYLNDPRTTAPTELLTRIHIPIA